MPGRRSSASGWPLPPGAKPESSRDQSESGFTIPLRRTFQSHPSVLAAVFVDPDGECVDYCAVLSPFDAKQAGAQMKVTGGQVRRFARGLGGGQAAKTQIVGRRRCFVLREVGMGYALVVVVEGRLIDQAVLVAVETCAALLRKEAGLPTPSWDPESTLEVHTRDATGWAYAPARYVEHGQAHHVEAVLGRWEEGGGIAGGRLTCFRVRNEQGTELTLAFDGTEKVWLRW